MLTMTATVARLTSAVIPLIIPIGPYTATVVLTWTAYVAWTHFLAVFPVVHGGTTALVS